MGEEWRSKEIVNAVFIGGDSKLDGSVSIQALCVAACAHGKFPALDVYLALSIWNERADVGVGVNTAQMPFLHLRLRAAVTTLQRRLQVEHYAYFSTGKMLE